MANITSYTNDKSTRYRQDCLGELETENVSVLHEHGGIPVIQIVTKDITTGRHFRIDLSREETEAVMRIMLRGTAYGMHQLRAKFEEETVPQES